MVPASATRHVQYVALSELPGAARNPKIHDLSGIRASIGRFGFVAPCVLDERTGRLVAGHGRREALEAMQVDGESPPAGIQLDDIGRWLVPVLVGWASRSDAEAEAYIIADNEWTIRGGWDDSALAEVLADLNGADPELLAVAGFSEGDLLALLSDQDSDGEADEADGEGRPGSDGSLLAIADVSIDEPRHQVATGDVWLLGQRHYLAVVDVMSGWPTWRPLLDGDDALFVPYPGPYAPLAIKADDYRMVMVQPDHYLAGHILDKYAAVRGDDAIEKADV